jgi:CheY-like chemotaxis protein
MSDPRILIVEDNPVNLELVLQLLEDDYSLLIARDGAEGLAMAVAERPDLILLDLSLPKMSGWEVCQSLREQLGDQAMPVVALTAHAIKGDREKAMETGFDAYLTKPIDEDLLFETVRSFLQR